ncbi:MAG: glycerol-3-phosphate acyltransferase [Deltaproteobacteria bacterium]|nr:glycerol-3-phosphate acyltransferase [Deltaproteobacteria bacterium]
MAEQDIICVLIAYFFGGICSGYYLVRFKANLDIRDYGSGGVGARNVGRVLGKSGFIVTLLLDSLKGITAILLARWLDLTEPAVSFVLIAVTAGHIWPLFLHFRGGRGVSTAIGAYLVYDYSLALLLLAITLILTIFQRDFIINGLAAFMLLPLAAYALELPGYQIITSAGVSVIILYAHRRHICKKFAELLKKKES